MSIEDWQEQQAQIGDRLRDLRQTAGLTGQALAAKFGWQQSKVSRLENSRQLPTAADIRQWVIGCNGKPANADEMIAVLDSIQAGHRDWKRQMRRGPAAVQASYNQLVTDSAVVRHFETAYVPGLLQTAGYAHAVLAEASRLAEVADPDVDAAVMTRMQRQQMLYDPAKQFQFLLCEAVLRWVICPPAVMRAQLDRLQSVIGLPNVRFGVLPFGVQLTTTPQNSFQLYDDVAVAETFVGEWTYTAEDSATYARILDQMWLEAMEGTAARQLILAAMEALPEA